MLSAKRLSVLFAFVLLSQLPRPASADFANGGFESGVTGWSAQYGYYNGGGIGSITWSNTNTGQSPTTTITSQLLGNTIYYPFCGSAMGQVGGLGDRVRRASRLFQTVILTPDDVGDNECGLTTISLRYRAVLATTAGHTADETSRYAIELLHNGNRVAYEEHFCGEQPYSDWADNPSGPFYAKQGTFSHTIRAAAPGDTITLIASVAGCVLEAHGGLVWLDCATISPVGAGFGAPQNWTGQTEPSGGWYPGDFNGDGFCDIARTGMQVLTSTGASFGAPAAWGAGPTAVSGLRVGDFNGDGRDDLAGFWPGHGALVGLSTGSAFAAPALWSGDVGSPQITAGDFDGDGFDDLLVATSSLTCGVMLSNGTTFAPAVSWSSESPAVGGWYPGDFNGDGRCDLGRWGGWAFEVLLSTGSSFATPTAWTTAGPGSPRRWYIGDFDCDGRDDLARLYPSVALPFSTNALATFAVLSSTGSSFNLPIAWTDPTIGSSSVYLGDFDGSGSVDMLRHAGAGYVSSSCATCECFNVAAASVHCDPENGTQHFLNLNIRNLSPLPATSLDINPLGAFVATPPSITLSPPLMSRRNRTVTFTLSGTNPFDLYCPLLTLNNAGGPVCDRNVCFGAADCPCMQVRVQDVICTTDGSGDALINFRVYNASGSAAQFVEIESPNPPLPVSPTSYDIPLLPTGQVSGLLTTRVGAPFSTEILCLTFVLRDGFNQELCREEFCVDLIECPHSWVYCCSPVAGCVVVDTPADCLEIDGVWSSMNDVCNGCMKFTRDDDNIILGMTPLGGGVLTTDADQNLLVHQLGDTGEDGVRLDLGGATDASLSLFTIDPQDDLPDGTYLRATATGQQAGLPDSALGELLVTRFAGEYTIDADFSSLGSFGHWTDIYSEGILIASQFQPDGAPLSSSDWFNTLSVDRTDADNNFGIVLGFVEPVTIFADGIPYFGEELHIRADFSAIPVDYVQQLDLTAAGVPSFTITGIERTLTPCEGDVDLDRDVDLTDLALLLAAFEDSAEGDVNGDGLTDLTDLAILLSQFDATCP